MKKLVERIQVTRALFISYIILFVALGLIRFTEHRNIGTISGKIHAVSNLSSMRQNILSQLQNSNSLLRISELRLLNSPDSYYKGDTQSEMYAVKSHIDSLLNEYRKLIEDSTEQRLYDSILSIQRQIRKSREQLARRIINGGISEVHSLDSEDIQPAFERLRDLNTELSYYVYLRDTATNQNFENSIVRISHFASLMTIIIAILIIVLGLVVVMTIRTITRKKNKLADSRARYRKFIEETNELITELDTQGRIRFANKKFKEIMGYEDHELSNMQVFDLMTEESALESRTNLIGAGSKDSISKVSRVLVNKNGQKVFIEGNIVWEYKDGILDGVTGFFRNVTDQKLLEISLKESELKFRQLFYMAPVPMYTFDPETMYFQSANDAALYYYGYSEKEFLCKTIMDIRPEDERDRTMHQVNLIVKENKKYIDYYRHLKKDGSITNVEIFASRILLNHKPVVLASVVDITGRRQTENKITQAIIKTQEEERYEIGSELHDNVCQLLASAKMSLSIMRNQLPVALEQPYTQSLESIILATEEIRNLSHRLAPVFFKNTTLKESFERLLQTFNIGSNYSITFFFDEKVEALTLSRELQLNLYRILQEQLRNIIKYSRATEINLDILVYKNDLKLLIGDNGKGFDTNTTPSGIGLANMKRRAEFFSGRFELYSAPGEGCEVIISIPLYAIGN